MTPRATGLDEARTSPRDGAGPDHDDRAVATRALAALRLLLLPVVFVADRLVSHPTVGTRSFDLILTAATAYSVVMLSDAWRASGPRAPAGLLVGLDLAFVSALAFASGRAFADLRAAFFVLPLSAALLLTSKRAAAAVTIATAIAYLTVAFTHPATTRQPFAVTVTQMMYIVWVGIAAVVLATLLSRRRHKILELSEARGRLVAQAIEAEERARKRVSEALHDHAIQDLLTARQDLAEARSGNASALDRAELAVRQALGQLRSTVSDLHPYLLDHLDLQAALETIAAQHAAHGGYQAVIDTDPGALGTHDQLIAALARELLSNAAQHANASRVTLHLARHDQSIILDVADDGCGFTAQQQTDALRAGHIGLAASRERVEASGGSLQITSHPGHGTRVRCLLPAGAHSTPAQHRSATHTSADPANGARTPVTASAPSSPNPALATRKLKARRAQRHRAGTREPLGSPLRAGLWATVRFRPPSSAVHRHFVDASSPASPALQLRCRPCAGAGSMRGLDIHQS